MYVANSGDELVGLQSIWIFHKFLFIYKVVNVSYWESSSCMYPIELLFFLLVWKSSNLNVNSVSLHACVTHMIPRARRPLYRHLHILAIFSKLFDSVQQITRSLLL